jgi:ABC-type transporter Mla subunit MlaD
MRKREREALQRSLKKLTDKVAAKRDELRAIVGDISAIIESVNAAGDGFEDTLHHLKEANFYLDQIVVDGLSQNV